MERAALKIHGIVQGVGFRPFIHRLVRENDLNGFIKNTSSGVELELEGEPEAIRRFIAEVPERMPKLAVIEGMETEYGLPCVGFQGFEIRGSKTEALRNTLISPDISICDDCLRELFSPEDRRYRYPFINCTNCGPRFTIIKDVPYDRDKTSMGRFPMCPDCDREYHDIENRRYHAQPDACPVCGPDVFFLDGSDAGISLTDGHQIPDCPRGEDAIRLARDYLKAGKIVAVKGLGGIHLACRCDDPEIAARLRSRKRRDEKPFAIMCRNTECARALCEVSEEERKVLESFRRPIVLLPKKKEKKDALRCLSENNSVGIMLPYTPVHYLLFGDDIDALIMTSANLSETPILRDNAEALRELNGIADGFLLHNRDIQTRCDDSLCAVTGGKEYFLRRSRGYVPFPVKTPVLKGAPHILACGAEQKASFCLTKGDYAFPSQHIGDLKNWETYEHYQEQIAHFERLFDIDPAVIACDMHPDYLSSEYAQQLRESRHLPIVPVQHHHAHMAACMADNDLEGDVIGLIWDGTGLGTDGTIWGGECLTGGYETFRRFGTIRPIPLIGGDLAVTELNRTAFALLKDSGCASQREDPNGMLERILSAGINCPLSSGMGRLFDGVSAILGIRLRAGYEGQGAVLLEAAADPGEEEVLDYALEETGGLLEFDWRPMIRQIASLKEAGTGADVLAARFMNTLADMAVRQCEEARKQCGLNRVVLSGGTFQNMTLMGKLPGLLRKKGFEVYHHRRVSCNDEGLSLGQAAVARYRSIGAGE